jgi:hypothetical protein
MSGSEICSMVPGVKLSKSILFLSTTVLVCTQTLQPRVHTRSNVIAIVYVQPLQCWEGRPSYHRLQHEVGCTQKVYLSTVDLQNIHRGCSRHVQIREVTVAQGNWCLPPVQRSYSKKTPRRRRLNMDILQFFKNL